MGVAQRKIEAAGLSTITVSNTPELTAAVRVPCIAPIEHPFGWTMGMPKDDQGQQNVLRGALRAAETTTAAPGGIEHLPSYWPETPKEAQAHPAEPPPIVSHLKRHPWHLPRLVSRNVPERAI